MKIKWLLLAVLQGLGIQSRAELALYKRHFPHMIRVKKILGTSRSQCLQDAFAILELKAWKYREPGFFVEFGATDGVALSNTYLLEKCFGFTGILAEPAKIWHKALEGNRKVAIETRCVWDESGKFIDFAEVLEPELSTARMYMGSDHWKRDGNETKYYTVETISLNELLETNGAPRHIDFLSIDTEGSEFLILNALNFSKYSFRVITVEHNFSQNRAAIKMLLEKNGYRRVLDRVSGQDDWYLLKN